jgi:hypothetical protein
MWPGIVSSRGKHAIAAVACRHLAEILRAKPNIALWVGQGVETGVGQADLRGRRA